MVQRVTVSMVIGLLASLLLCGLLVHAALREEDRLENRRLKHEARSIETGAALFDSHCRTCHGLHGEGIGQLGPALSDRHFFTERLQETGWQDTLLAYVESSTAHGRLVATRPKYAGNESTAVMTPWLDSYGGPLRPDQVRDLSNYIVNWKKTALGEVELAVLELPQISLDDPETINRGRAVFKQSCSTCHTAPGFSAAKKKGPDLAGIAATAASRVPGKTAEAYIRESFLLPDEYIVPGFEPDLLGHHCGGVLSVSQLDAVTAYLLALK